MARFVVEFVTSSESKRLLDNLFSYINFLNVKYRRLLECFEK